MTVCGCYFVLPVEGSQHWLQPRKQYLPLVSLRSHTRIVSASARTTLSQAFVNPDPDRAIPELRYAFPLYDGVSVVAFFCTVNDDRVIRGVVREKDAARRAYKDAVQRGETAGLLEQLPDAADVFTTTIGNVPAGARFQIDITYLGELKHDADADGIRFTIPTSIAPRYGDYPGELLARPPSVSASSPAGIEVVVDAELPTAEGNYIKSIKSPSHPVSVEMQGPGGSMATARAEISISSLELDKDVIVIVVPARPETPAAVLEQHPTIPSQRALMATFVPRFNLPQSRPEIVFVCDRSGSMGTGRRMPNLKTALHVFLKSLPLGVKFNIVSFGSNHSFLFERSRSYDQAALDEAGRHVDSFSDNYGGTEMHDPIDAVFRRRYADMDLEVFVLTDGEVWQQSQLFDMVARNVRDSHGSARLFTLGLGNDVSHSLVEGLARAGRGFAQVVADGENLNTKVVRMLKASLSPHINNCSFEIQYGPNGASAEKKPSLSADDFEIVENETDADLVVVEKVLDALVLDVPAGSKADEPVTSGDKKTTSLFSAAADPDADMQEPGAAGSDVEPAKYAHVPAVPVPKLLQAPFEVPPMYNFNRVAVYMLLGPSSSQRTPKAVVLRGTTRSHGSVELSIPVQALAQPGETVHQLAAKKAVQELEEGRGWLVHAKDAVDGKLLKDKHEGRFADMVEREAVRLGVTFQVGGKWCSFVAVDDKTSKVEDVSGGEKREQSPPTPEPHFRRRGPARFLMARQESPNPFVSPELSSFAMNAFPAAAPRGGLMSVGGGGGLMSVSAAPAPPPPPSGAAMHELEEAELESYIDFGSFGDDDPGLPSPPLGAAMHESERVKKSDADMGFGLFGGDDPTPALATLPDAGESSDEDMGYGLFDGPTPPREPDEPLTKLVKLQAFEGFWDWSEALREVLGLSEADVVKALSGDQGRVGATACAVAFLRKKMADRADEWELLVDKAAAWLEDQGTAVEEIMTSVEKLF